MTDRPRSPVSDGPASTLAPPPPFRPPALEPAEASGPSRGTLPAEVLGFLAQSHAQSLLIRGPSGSGKTTFALNALTHFPGRRVFATCWVDQDRVRSFFPWIDDDRYRIEVVDVNPTEDVRWVAQALTLLRLRGRGPVGSGVSIQDRWAWLPPKLQELWRSLHPDQPTLVAIDSWDSLVETYLGPPASSTERLPDRAEIERILVRSMGLVNAHIMLVVERNHDSQLDYLVDGIVNMDTAMQDGRQERWIRIHKLRGIRVDEAEYPFTLDGGEFETLIPLSEARRDRALPAEPDPGPIPGYLWPGATDFAEAFGRLPIGQMSLVEIDEGVSSAGLHSVLVPMVDSVVQSGGRVLLSLPPIMRVDEFWKTLHSRFDSSPFDQTVRILVTGPNAQVSEEVRGAVIPIPNGGGGGASMMFRETLDFVKQPPPAGPGNGAFHWHTGLRMLVQATGMDYNTDSAPRVAQQYLAEAPVHLMILGQRGDHVFSSLSEMSAIHIRFRDRSGRIFLCGVRPRTQSFALGEGFGASPYRLVRVV